MADEVIGSAVVEVTADASGVSTGIAQATNAVQGFENAAVKAGNNAGKALSGATDQAASSAAGLTREQKLLIQSIDRYNTSIGKTRGEVLEYRAAQAGLSAQVKDQIAAIKAQEAALMASGNQFNKYGQTQKQVAAALRGVPAQVTDIIVSLQGGQAPLTVLLQQGGQLKDMFGGVVPAVKALGGALLNLATNPIVLAVAGFAALAYAVSQVESRAREANSIATLLTATGRAADFNRERTEALRRELQLLPGVNREVSASIVTSLAKDRDIGVAIFEDLAKSAVDYAAATGQAIPQAADALVKAFSDPLKGAKELDEQLNILTADQLLTIEKMVEMGDKAGAQRLLLDALKESTQGLAKDGLTPMQTATNDLGNAWDEFKKSIGDPQPLNIARQGVVGVIEALTLLTRKMNETDWTAKWAEVANKGRGAFPALGILAAGIDRNDTPTITRVPLSKPVKSGGGGSGSGSMPAITAAAPGSNSEIKSLLESTKEYKSKASEIEKVNNQITRLKASMKALREDGKGDSVAYKELAERLQGANEKVAQIQKRGVTQPKAFQDDAATKFLQTLRETEASLQAQIDGNAKLTNSQKEQVKFQQLLADLKDKRILTADQKSLVANQQAITAQLEKNVQIENEVKAREEARKKQEEINKLDAQFAERSRQRTEAISSSRDTRNQGYDRTLTAFGQSDQQREQVEAQRTIFREFQRMQLDLVKNTPEHLLGSDKYIEESMKIKAALDQALMDQQNYYSRLNLLQGDWLNGAQRSLRTYVEDTANISAQTEKLFTSAFSNMEDAIVTFVSTGKLSFANFADSIIADITRMIVKQQILAPLSSSIGSGGFGVFGSFLGSLLGGTSGSSASAAFMSPDGSRAVGGPVRAGGMYEVNENRPELLNYKGKQFLMMGDGGGWVDSAPSGGNVTNITNAPQIYMPKADRKTVGQVARINRRILERSERNA